MIEVQYRRVGSGWEAYAGYEHPGYGYCETSSIASTQQRAKAKLEHYMIIIARNGHDASMAFMDANCEEMEKGAKSDKFARQYTWDWLVKTKQTHNASSVLSPP